MSVSWFLAEISQLLIGLAWNLVQMSKMINLDDFRGPTEFFYCTITSWSFVGNYSFSGGRVSTAMTGFAMKCGTDIHVLLRMNCNYSGDLLKSISTLDGRQRLRQWMVCVVCQRSSNLTFNVIIMPSLQLRNPRKSARTEGCPNAIWLRFVQGDLTVDTISPLKHPGTATGKTDMML